MAEPEDASGADLDRLKLKFDSWNSDREDFVEWMNAVTAVVRSIRHGNEIEDYLDLKLERVLYQAMMVSSIITEDPDFMIPANAKQEDGEVDPRFATAAKATVTKQLFQTPKTVRSVQSLRKGSSPNTRKTVGSYWDLSRGALHLDQLLFGIIRSLVKGSKMVVIECAPMQSYIQAMCLLHKHAEINRNDRIARAFAGVDNLKYKSNAQEWATSCITKIRELFASRASMTHYALTRILHSLDGKLKTVQYKIAEDLGSLEPDDEVNIYDLIQTYASMTTSVGDSSSQVMAIEDDDCHYCGEKGHHAVNCPKKKRDVADGNLQENGKGGKGKKRHDKWKFKCDFCGRKGHTEARCNFKAASLEKVAVAQAGSPAEGPQQGTAIQAPNQQQPTAATLAAYLTQLQKGNVPAQRFVNTTAVVPPRRIRHTVGRRGERIGEASHPGPSTEMIKYSRPSVLSMILVTIACAISLFDGMGCGLVGLRRNNIDFDRYLAAEISEDARRIAKNVNPNIVGKPNIDHNWHSNVLDITEEGIAALGHNSVKVFLAGPPCQDFSLLRLIVKKSAKKRAAELRPGLDGPNGRLFRETLRVLQWVLKYNPDCEFLIEGVDFSDMDDDWQEICGALGDPMIIDSRMYSFTKRTRAYWTNIARAYDMPPPMPALDPSACFKHGRTPIQHESMGERCMRQIAGSWRGSPSSLYASTAKPLLVHDPRFCKPQHIFPEEAELLHGLEAGCTAGRGASNKQRLEAIGRGWDVNVTNRILSLSMHANDGSAKAAFMTMCNIMSPDEMSERVMMMDQSTRDWYISTIEANHSWPNDGNHQADQVEGAATEDDMGIITDLEAVGQMGDAEMAIMGAVEALEPCALAEILMAMEPETRDWYISMIARQCMSQEASSSVLDSGSSRHLQSRVCITQNDDLTPLSGFDGSVQWTEGNGYVPATMQDSITDKGFIKWTLKMLIS